MSGSFIGVRMANEFDAVAIWVSAKHDRGLSPMTEALLQTGPYLATGCRHPLQCLLEVLDNEAHVGIPVLPGASRDIGLRAAIGMMEELEQQIPQAEKHTGEAFWRPLHQSCRSATSGTVRCCADESECVLIEACADIDICYR